MASAATVPSAQESNSFSRIFGALFSPKPTFESIARRPTWIVPTLILCVMAIIVVGIFSHRGGWPSFFERQMANNSRVQQMTQAQQQRVLEVQLKVAPIAVEVEAAVIPIIALIVLAAIFLGVFKGLAGAQFGFKQSLGVIAYAWTPGLIAGLLGILVVSLKDITTVDIQNIVASNAGAFLSETSPRWMVALLGSLDIFSFWEMILMAIGYSALAPKKLSFGKALGWILGVWILYVLVKTGLTAAFS